MSGAKKGKLAKPGVGLARERKCKPWEMRYPKGRTALRSNAMPGPKRVDVRGCVGAMTTFKAKPGLGGRRHRLRCARVGGVR